MLLAQTKLDLGGGLRALPISDKVNSYIVTDGGIIEVKVPKFALASGGWRRAAFVVITADADVWVSRQQVGNNPKEAGDNITNGNSQHLVPKGASALMHTGDIASFWISVSAITGSGVVTCAYYEGDEAQAAFVPPPPATLFLLHGDGADGATTTTDERGHTVTLASGAALDADRAQFGPTSIKLPAGSTVNIAGIGAADAVEGGWSLEFSYSTTTGSFPYLYVYLYDDQSNDAAVITVDHDNGAINCDLYNPTSGNFESIYNSTLVPSGSSFGHIALVRDAAAGTYALYGLGTRIGLVTSATNVAGFDRVYIYNGGSAPIWLDEIRGSGVARYSGASITPPAAPFTLE